MIIDLLQGFLNWLFQYVDRAYLVTVAVGTAVAYTVITLIKVGTKRAVQKAIENKPSTFMYILGLCGIVTMLFAAEISSYLQVDFWYIFGAGILLSLFGFAKLIFRGGKVAYKGIRQV